MYFRSAYEFNHLFIYAFKTADREGGASLDRGEPSFVKPETYAFGDLRKKKNV